MNFFATIQLIAFILFVPVSIYLGTKIKKLLNAWHITVHAWLFWAIFLLLVGTVIISRSILLIWLFYMGLLFLLYDIILLVLNSLSRPPRLRKLSQWAEVWRFIGFHGLMPVILSITVMLYGYFNAENIRLTEYQINIPDTQSTIQTLNIVFISDIHAGTAVKRIGLEHIAQQTAALKPDIILLGGDVFDNRSTQQDQRDFYELLGNLASTYGTFYIHGNHDRQPEIRLGMEQAGITVLADEYQLIGNSFYLVGRKDPSMRPRLSLNELLESLNPAVPIILLDHRPTDLDLASSLGVDLQLSGHTHHGQIFPGNYLVGQFNELDYGYKQINTYQIIVNSGAGTWNFPFRTGSHSELVHIMARF